MEPEKAKVAIVAAAVIKQNGKYLLVQEGKGPAHKLWNFPAGRVDVGETIEQAAIREAKEESGYDVRLVRKLATIQDTSTESVKHAFEARITGGELSFPPNEIIAARWFTGDEIRNMKLTLRDRYILEAIAVMEETPRTSVLVAADCVVFDKNGSLLLIRRKYPPFEGMYALPGGMVEVNETVEAAARRELFEETGIEAESLELVGVYSKLGRDPRGRSITAAYIVVPKNSIARAGDDAATAHFVDDWQNEPLAFDHSDIVADALRLIRDR